MGNTDGGVVSSQTHRDPGGAAGENVQARVTKGANEPKVGMPSVAARVPETGTAFAAVKSTSNAKNEAVAELVLNLGSILSYSRMNWGMVLTARR